MKLDPIPDWPEIWFLRHGETDWNLEGRIQGRKDSPLTAKGRAQAQQQALIIRDIAAHVAAGTGGIYVSPLGRARQTAAVALVGHDPLIDPRLAEIDSGDWEGALKADLPHGANDLTLYTAAPNGEGWAGLSARVRSFADDLTGPSIIVSHGLWGQMLRGMAQGMTSEQMAAQTNRQGCVYHLKAGEEVCLAG